VIVVGHGTWINLCCRVLLNRSIEHATDLHAKQFYNNAGVTVFEKSDLGHLIQTGENIIPYAFA
jgi:hypothetical protein